MSEWVLTRFDERVVVVSMVVGVRANGDDVTIVYQNQRPIWCFSLSILLESRAIKSLLLSGATNNTTAYYKVIFLFPFSPSLLLSLPPCLRRNRTGSSSWGLSFIVDLVFSLFLILWYFPLAIHFFLFSFLLRFFRLLLLLVPRLVLQTRIHTHTHTRSRSRRPFLVF